MFILLILKCWNCNHENQSCNFKPYVCLSELIGRTLQPFLDLSDKHTGRSEGCEVEKTENKRHKSAEEKWRNMTDQNQNIKTSRRWEAERGEESVERREKLPQQMLSLGKLPRFTENALKSFTTQKKPSSSKNSYLLSPSEANKHWIFAPLESRHSCRGCLFFWLHENQSVVKLFYQAKPQLSYNSINTALDLPKVCSSKTFQQQQVKLKTFQLCKVTINQTFLWRTSRAFSQVKLWKVPEQRKGGTD